MSDIQKSWVILIMFCSITSLCGFVVGQGSTNRSSQKEITLLSIELTKLEIKKLKGVCNGS